MSFDVGVGDRRWSEVYPEMLSYEATAEEFCSPEIFARECELVFRRAWLYAGHTQDLKSAGDFFVRDYPATKGSVLVLRDKEGKVRGFHNVCRHRCNKLVSDCVHGSRTAFTCRYHGWTYDLEGRLIGLPDPDGLLNKPDLSLMPVATELWNGFIFVNFSSKPRQTLAEFLGDLCTHSVNDYAFGQEFESWTFQADVKANWKILIDLSSEAYHVNALHKDSVRRLYTDKQNRYSHIPLIKFHGLHRQVSYYGNAVTKVGPAAQLSIKYGSAAESRFGMAKDLPGVNPGRLNNWGIDGYHIFPNFHIVLFGALWHFFSSQPLAVDRTLWEHRIFFPKADNAGARFAHEFSRSLQQLVVTEDISVAESIQAGVESGAVPKLSLHDQEIGLRHTRKALADYMAS